MTKGTAGLIQELGVVSLPLPREATFLAGKAFHQYKLRGGTKSSPLLTRDPRRVATAYPRLKLVSP
ncbi:MAG: hypothetical protein WCG80_16005 [Spirochaetales bacterium]